MGRERERNMKRSCAVGGGSGLMFGAVLTREANAKRIGNERSAELTSFLECDSRWDGFRNPNEEGEVVLGRGKGEALKAKEDGRVKAGTHGVQCRVLVGGRLPEVDRALADKVKEGVGDTTAREGFDLSELDADPLGLDTLLRYPYLNGLGTQ